MPLINIDLGFSAFLQPGPGIDVVNKILSFGPVGARGGGPQNRDLDQLDQRQIAILKKKLRGAKVSWSSECGTLPCRARPDCCCNTDISSLSLIARAHACTQSSP